MLKLFFANSNFRNLALFSTVGGIGRGLFGIFMMWAIHAMYHNPMYTGIAGFMFGAPLVFGFLVGPFVDKWDKTRVLRATEFIKFCVVAVMLLSYLHFYAGAWVFFLGIFIFSAATMFSSPAFTALLPKVVDSADLVKANAAMNIFGILGGLGMGAVLLFTAGDELNFTRIYIIIAAMLLVAALFTFLFRHKEATPPAPANGEYLGELKEGFAFMRKGALLFLTVATVSMSFFNDIAYVNFPMFVEMRLGAASYYVLFSFLALTGGMLGSFVCRLAEPKFKMWQILAACIIVAGAARIVFVHVIEDNFARAILMYLVYVGLGSVVGILYHVLIQKLPPKNLTARVYTATTSLSAGAAAVGAIAGGILGTHLSPDNVLFIQGGAYIAIGALLCMSKSVRDLGQSSDSRAQ
jgi:MFS family permease